MMMFTAAVWKTELVKIKRYGNPVIYVLIFCIMPLFIFLGSRIFSDRQYMIVSSACAVTACAVFFLSFERHGADIHKTVLTAAMTALSVAGRVMFAYVPSFKPVTAVVMICGINLGAEAGFVCGALSGFLSNFIFMQGPWTPFQMFIWGIIGFLSGVLSKPLKDSRAVLVLFGAAAGVLYSAFMDIWTAMWWDGTFSMERYTAALVTALPVTAVYAASNVVFLLLLARPLGKKIDRVKKKYGIE